MDGGLSQLFFKLRMASQTELSPGPRLEPELVLSGGKRKATEKKEEETPPNLHMELHS